MKSFLFKLTFLFIILLNFIFIKTSQAANLSDAFNIVTETASSSYKTNGVDFQLALGNIILAILSLVGAIFIIFAIYAGYLYMTASGNEQKVDKAKQILKDSMIGIFVIVSAYAISYFIINIFI